MENMEIIVHASDYPVERESIDSWIQSNLEGKLNAYVKKHEKTESPTRLELTLKRESDGKCSGKIALSVGSETFRSEREHFDHLDDLVNHLFGHLKDQMAR